MESANQLATSYTWVILIPQLFSRQGQSTPQHDCHGMEVTASLIGDREKLSQSAMGIAFNISIGSMNTFLDPTTYILYLPV